MAGFLSAVALPVDTLQGQAAISVADHPLYSLSEHPMLQDQKSLTGIFPRPRSAENKSLSFFLALGLLFFLAWLKQIFPRHISGLFSFFDGLPGGKKFRSKQVVSDGRASLGFLILYALALSYVVYTAADLYGWGKAHSNWIRFLLSLAAVLTLLSARRISTGLVSWVFGRQEQERAFRFSNSQVNELTGMVLFPLCIVMMLSGGGPRSATLSICVLVLLGALLVKFFRHFRLVNNLLRIDFIHFLLYLCAFEIMPVWIIVRLVAAQ